MTTVTRPALLSACAYILQGAGLTVQELAAHMGVKLEAAPIALPPGQRLDLTNRPRLQETLKLADNPDGISVAEIVTLWGVGQQTAWMYLDELHRGLHIVRVKAPGVRGSRYFRDAGHASRWVDSHAQALAAEREREAAQQQAQEAARQLQAAQQAAAAAERQQKAAQKAAAPKPAPKPKAAPTPAQNVTLFPKSNEVRVAGEAANPAGVKPKQAERKPFGRIEAAPPLPPDPRWQSFASMRPGIDPDTGREWGAR